MQGTGMSPFRIFTKSLAGEKGVDYAFNQLEALKKNYVSNEELRSAMSIHADKFVDKQAIMAKYRQMVNAKGRLAEFGIDPDAVVKRGAFTPEELLDVRRKAANYLYGEQTAIDFPLFKSSGWLGRNMFKFRMDQYTNFKTISNDLIRKEGIERGNWKPLLSIILVGPPAGAMVGQAIRKIIKGQPLMKEDEDILDLYVQALLTAHFIGVAQDLYKSAANSPTGALGAVAGPVPATISKDVSSVVNSIDQGSMDPLKKRIVESVPGGSIIAPHVYPKE
jgi:hypothetical protein